MARSFDSGAYIDVQTWTSDTSNSFPVSIALHSPPVSISEFTDAYPQKNETDATNNDW